MNTVVEQRNILDMERRCILPSPGMMPPLGDCERHHQQEEESVFLTPISSPGAYSNDGTGYAADLEVQYFASGEPASSGIVHIDTHLQAMQPSSAATSPFMAPGSPCDEQQYCGSPYSPASYDNSSPHSISCSSPPHGSPASLPGSENGQFGSPYMSPSPSVHNIPVSTCNMPISSGAMSMPYSIEDAARLIYTVPATPAGFFPNAPHWVDETVAMTEYSAFQAEHPHIQHGGMIEGGEMQHGSMIGEVPVLIMDQMRVPVQNGHLDNAPAPLAFYHPEGSPSASPEVFYNVPAEMTATSVPQFHHKPAKTPKKKKVPVVQVNDEHIKDIPTSAQLWEFTLQVLKKPAYHYMVNWENRKEGLFRFHDAPAFAALWGKHRNRPNMTYDKVARALRYYYKRDILNQVGGRLTYRFSKRLNKLYATDD